MAGKGFRKKGAGDDAVTTSKLKMNASETVDPENPDLEGAIARLGEIYDLETVNFEVQTLEDKNGQPYTALVYMDSEEKESSEDDSPEDESADLNKPDAKGKKKSSPKKKGSTVSKEEAVDDAESSS